MAPPLPRREPKLTALDIDRLKEEAAKFNEKRAHLGKKKNAVEKIDHRVKYTPEERRELSKKIRSLQCWGCGRKFPSYRKLKQHQASCYWYVYFARDDRLDEAPFFNRHPLTKQQRYIMRNPEKRSEIQRRYVRKKKLAKMGISMNSGSVKASASLSRCKKKS